VLTEFHEANPSAFIIGHNEAPGHASRGCPCFNSKAYVRSLFDSWGEQKQPPENFMDAVDTGEDIEQPWKTIANRFNGSA
jgi:hypothetical protein